MFGQILNSTAASQIRASLGLAVLGSVMEGISSRLTPSNIVNKANTAGQIIQNVAPLIPLAQPVVKWLWKSTESRTTNLVYGTGLVTLGLVATGVTIVAPLLAGERINTIVSKFFKAVNALLLVGAAHERHVTLLQGGIASLALSFGMLVNKNKGNEELEKEDMILKDSDSYLQKFKDKVTGLWSQVWNKLTFRANKDTLRIEKDNGVRKGGGLDGQGYNEITGKGADLFDNTINYDQKFEIEIEA